MNDEAEGEGFEALLAYLRENRGFDFTGYKRMSLQRRVRKRAGQVGLADYSEYLDYLQVHPEEFTLLFNTILINVTGFFRDPAAWEYVAREVLPRLIAARAGGPLRVWSTGCASGEEPYSLALLLAEALGMEAFRNRVKIYATDVDGDALAFARRSAFSAKDLESVPAELRAKYFAATDGHFVPITDIRRALIFGRHDLLQDAPISHLDLLLCRNTLMYFTAEAQAKILARLHFALKHDGFMFVGRAEMLLTHARLFAPLDLKHRVFIKLPTPKAGLPDREFFLSEAAGTPMPAELSSEVRLRQLVSDAAPVAQLVLGAQGRLLMINERARSLLDLTSGDLGLPLREVSLSVGTMQVAARLDDVFRDRQPHSQLNVAQRLKDGQVHYLDVYLAPLLEDDGTLLGVSLTCTDVTSHYQLQLELTRANENVESANQELESSNEELDTSNEELQSSNEELETMNAELDSTNNELQALNVELLRRTSQLDNVNQLMDSIFARLQLGVAIIDNDGRVELWNRAAENLWGLRPPEAEGRLFLQLDIGLPMKELEAPIRECLTNNDGPRELLLESTNRKGKPITCRIVCTTLDQETDRPRAVILMETVKSGR